MPTDPNLLPGEDGELPRRDRTPCDTSVQTVPVGCGEPPSVRDSCAGAIADACWSRIGVQGDRSCSRLAEAVHCRNCPVFAQAGPQLFDRPAPPHYADEWTRQLAEVVSETTDDTVSLLAFRVGAEWLAIEVRWLVEVVKPQTILRVPRRTDRFFLGLTNIRGELQLCASVQELLGIESPADAEIPSSSSAARSTARFLVTERDQSRWVLPVDQVDGVHRVPSASLKTQPCTVRRSARFYSQAVFHLGDRAVGLLSEERLFEALAGVVR